MQNSQLKAHLKVDLSSYYFLIETEELESDCATSYCSEESTKTYVVMRESGAFWPIRVQLGGESLK